jgi:uncharacterized membrane protein HdeD (DUF308 family)
VAGDAPAPSPMPIAMRTANYIFSVISIILGIVLILFMLTQTTRLNIGTTIGVVLVINGIVRLWFAQDEE